MTSPRTFNTEAAAPVAPAAPAEGVDVGVEATSYRSRPPAVVFWIAVGWVGVIVFVALTVQWLPLHSYATQAGKSNQGPSFSNQFLGTDSLGRSTLSRLAYGTRVSTGISLAATSIALAVGVLLGSVTAYAGGWVTEIVDVITDSVLAVPALVLLLALVLALRPSIPTLMIALSIVFIPPFTRLTRAQARSQLAREYVTAARAIGGSGPRVLFREVIPNVLPTVVSYAALVLPAMVIIEGALDYLGFGIPPPTPSWGEMIALAQPNLTLAAWPVLIPSIALALFVLSLNTIADEIRVRLDVRESQL
jgi:peptide/nickel transport system permease protein